jgi:MFS family permease
MEFAASTGHFNLAAGSLATMVGIGAALSNGIGGKLVQRAGYPVSFLTLAAIALLAFAMLWLAVPETLMAPAATGARLPVRACSACAESV